MGRYTWWVFTKTASTVPDSSKFASFSETNTAPSFPELFCSWYRTKSITSTECKTIDPITNTHAISHQILGKRPLGDGMCKGHDSGLLLLRQWCVLRDRDPENQNESSNNRSREQGTEEDWEEEGYLLPCGGKVVALGDGPGLGEGAGRHGWRSSNKRREEARNWEQMAIERERARESLGIILDFTISRQLLLVPYFF